MSPQLLTINIHTRRSDTVVADVVPDDDTDDEDEFDWTFIFDKLGGQYRLLIVYFNY